MKRYLKILSWLTLILLITDEKCSETGSSSVQPREDVYQTIQNEFTKDEISTETRMAFEKRAVQKLKDLVDYINIYADTSYSAEFREQAKQMIKDAFLSEQDVLPFITELGLMEDSTSQVLFTDSGSQFQTSADSIIISKEFQLTAEDDYEGEISFNFSAGEITSTERIKIVVRKALKQFGETSIYVWEVFFEL